MIKAGEKGAAAASRVPANAFVKAATATSVGSVGMGANLVIGAAIAPVALPALQFYMGEIDFVEWFFS